MKRATAFLATVFTFLTVAISGCVGQDLNAFDKESSRMNGENSEYAATSSEMRETEDEDSADESQSDDFASITKKTYYECRLEYFVNPIRGDEEPSADSQFGIYGTYGRHVMDNMVKLLSSDAFSEALIDGMEGVPTRLYENKVTTEYEAFRQTERYSVLLGKAKSAITFSYEVDSENPTLAASFIYVDLSVKEDKNFAEKLFENLLKNVVSYVEECMPVPNGYIGTRCVLEGSPVIEEVHKFEIEDIEN